MKILSAFEDFERFSLSALQGALVKLVYLAGLRNEAGEYAHWGLARAYGQESAKKAMTEAHARIFNESLCAPLQELAEQACKTARAQGLSTEDYIRQLAGNRERLVPQATRGGSAKHLDAVLLALEKIAQTVRCANHQAA